MGVIVLAMAGIYIFNKISLHNEASQIKDYGEKIEVFDGMINVVEKGQGQETIVLLPGLGTGSPVLDYTPLTKELENDYRVVVIEPFGYGLSSQTKRDRTSANIAEEIHEVVGKLNIDSFILMGHSISGIYSLNYVATYPESVKAFVGIDNSVPDQPAEKVDDRMTNFLTEAGIMRIMVNLSPNLKNALTFDGIDKKTYQQNLMLNLKNYNNKMIRNEQQLLEKNIPAARKQAFPKELPVLLFVAKDTVELDDNWLEWHKIQAESVTRGEVVELSGPHSLHHTQSKAIAEKFKQFMNEK
ncbi:hypothetical protein RV15_GL003088 [Enterococcus silesiacus]|uniref:AB hydrolase-1 domain-containing protein n=1 Tax=Enterococcus silesiacus TaxID=332949 RepID=A0AA91JPZ5_9ENTE|nr:hypothetical protein RV15_GL003088 [Enterococcus silesiacus]